MTRETKIGLVIGCSFLILVGLVVASKWRGGDDPSEEQGDRSPDVKLAQVQIEIKDKDGTKKNDKHGVLPVAPPQKKKDADKGGLRNVNDLQMQAPIGFGVSDQDKIAQLQAEIQKDKKLPLLPALPLPAPQNDLKPFGDNSSVYIAPMPIERKDGFIAPPMPVERKDGFIAPPGPLDRKDGFIAPPTPVDVQLKPVDKKEPFAVGAPNGFGQDPMPLPIKPFEDKKGPGGVEMPPNFGPINKDPQTFKPLDEKKGPGGIELPPNFGANNKDLQPFKPLDDKKGPGGIELPPNFGKDPAPIKPFDDKKGPGGVEMPPNFGALSGPFPAKPPEVPPLVPTAKDPPIKPVDKGPIPTIPPFNTNTSTPPINVGGKAPLPPVRDSSPDLYECRTGETSFAALSQRLYGSDRYADALQAYNRTHSGLLKNGALLSLNPPILNPGQQILVPQKELLDREVRTPTVVAPAAPTPAVKLAPVSPVGGVATAPIAPSIGGGRSYVVRNPNGESILDIAEQALGKRDRWTDIYRLNQTNPNVQPQSLLRIPAGTDLKLPGN
jgi:hypothetical protein